MRIPFLMFAVCSFILISCNGSQSGSTGAADSKPKLPAATPPQSKLGDAGTQLLMSVVSKYYALKNGLVATKAGRADSAAAELVTASFNLNAFLQKDSSNNVSLSPYIDTINEQSRQISGIKDESCERQRLAFGPLSSAMFGLLKNVDIRHAGIYREYCPMAFNEKGAYWLSNESEIENPYFGKKMMECGEVTDSL